MAAQHHAAFKVSKLRYSMRVITDQCQYPTNSAPTPPLTQHLPELVFSGLLLGSGRSKCAVATTILTLTVISQT